MNLCRESLWAFSPFRQWTVKKKTIILKYLLRAFSRKQTLFRSLILFLFFDLVHDVCLDAPLLFTKSVCVRVFHKVQFNSYSLHYQFIASCPFQQAQTRTRTGSTLTLLLCSEIRFTDSDRDPRPKVSKQVVLNEIERSEWMNWIEFRPVLAGKTTSKNNKNKKSNQTQKSHKFQNF